MTTDAPEFITQRMTARLAGWNRKTVARRVLAGSLPLHDVGGKRKLIARADLEKSIGPITSERWQLATYEMRRAA